MGNGGGNRQLPSPAHAHDMVVCKTAAPGKFVSRYVRLSDQLLGGIGMSAILLIFSASSSINLKNGISRVSQTSGRRLVPAAM